MENPVSIDLPKVCNVRKKKLECTFFNGRLSGLESYFREKISSFFGVNITKKIT
jgi:hypothetical protein